MLTEPQIERYARHVLLREVGGVGQERLLAARVAVVGLSPAGAWAAAYLALAGVGRLDLADPRPVTEADLVPFLGPADLGLPRDRALARAVAAYNPDVVARCLEAAGGDSSAGAEVRIVTDPTADAAASGMPVLAFAAGDAAIAGPLDPAGPCAACVARVLGDPEEATPAAALLAGSLAATLVLARIAARAEPAPGFLAGDGGTLRRLEPAAIPCSHRR